MTDTNPSSTVTTLDLIRHGSCQDRIEGGTNTDSEGVFRGRTDSPLNECGWHQMNQAIQQWQLPSTEINHEWQRVFTSPLKRCRIFAEQLGEHLQLPVEVETDLQEIDFGEWDGRRACDLMEQQPALVEAFWHNPLETTPPNGEPVKDFHRRVVSAFERLTQLGRGQHCLVVCHGGTIRSLMAHCLGIPLQNLSRIAVPHATMTQINIYHQPGLPDWWQLARHQPYRD